MSHFVPGVGPLDAKIIFIGEAPGEEEERLGVPFIGPSGRFLNQMLSAVGIDRNLCYLTNVVKQRPPNNNFDIFYIDKGRRQPSQLLLNAWESLRAELSALKPNIIIPLGGEALRALTGKTSIEHWRGSLLSSPFGKILPTYHPAFVLRIFTHSVTMKLDLKRAFHESKTPILELPTNSFILGPSYDQVMSYITRRPKRLAFDIETSGNLVRCLGLSDSPNNAICIPFMATSVGKHEPGTIISLELPTPETNSYWTPDQEYEILHELNNLFADPNVEKIAQNFPFDALILSHNFGIDTSRSLHMDTMGAHHTCYSELPKGLDYLCSIYTRTPYYSDFDVTVDKQTWLYNCYDAAVTLEISHVLDQELEKLGLTEYYRNQVNPAVISYARAETRGVLVDIDLRTRLASETREEVTRLGTFIKEYSHGKIENPNSDDQIKKFLFTDLGLAPVYHHKNKDKISTDKNAREKLKKEYPQHEAFFTSLDTFSKKSSLLSRLLERQLPTDNRLRTHYNVFGTNTGRLASSEPLFDFGTNLQNIDRGPMRRLVIADPGWSFIKADLSQAEFRIVVWKARIRRIIDRYLQDPNYDVHKELASVIFQIIIEQVTKEQRSTAKNGVYGGQYGMYYVTAAHTYKMPLQTAKFVLDRFHQILPEIKEVFWTEVQNEIRTTRCHVGPMGRRRLFFDRITDQIFRTAYSHSAQHLVGDLINRAFVLADELFDPSEAFPVLQVHDEIVVQARDSKAEYYGNFLRRLMEYPVWFPNVDVPMIIPAEVAIGKNWHDVTLLPPPPKEIA